MLRTATSTLARNSLKYSSRSVLRCVEHFHSTPLKEEKDKKSEVEAPKEPTILPSWWDPAYTIPVTFSLAIPALHYEWVTINEETQLAGVIIGFCAVVYSQAGDMIHKALVEKGDTVLKEANEIEDAVINNLEAMHEELKMSQTLVNDMDDLNTLTDETYVKLNEAGKVKPQYDFKAQVERVLHAIQQEETSVMEKAKHSLMAEATAAVEEQFITDKELKKAALDVAIAKIKGTATSGSDPVQGAFVKFFQEKAKSASSADTAAEEKQHREALVAKLNAIARNESYYFEFGNDGQPKMTV